MVKRAKVLSNSCLRILLAHTRANSAWPERDELILLLGCTCGMRITEIARIEVADVLFVSGEIRTEVGLRAAITKGCRRRSVFLTHAGTREAIRHYVISRRNGEIGTAKESAYGGLHPTSKLVLTPSGEPYALSAKKRRMASGEIRTYWAADGLQSYVTGLYCRAGLSDGYSSHSGRRTFATRLIEQGCSIDIVQRLLGHAELDHVGVYVEVSRADMREAVRKVL